MSEFLVLGAGMVGISTALELQSRGHSVLVVDRRSAGEETSHGNAGIIQVEAAEPYALPRHLPTLVRLGLGLNNDLTWSLSGLLSNADALWRYYRHSNRERHRQLSATYATLTARANDDHAVWIEAANAESLIRRDGYCCVFRDTASLDAAVQEMEHWQQTYGVHARVLDGAAYRAEEPSLLLEPTGAIHWPDCWTCSDPGGLTRHYAELFLQRGGSLIEADAMTLTSSDAGWQLQSAEGTLSAEQVVVALGPWSPSLLRRFGYRIPMIYKRGYHAHYPHAATVKRPLLDVANGIVASPMRRGLRLCTGAALVAMDAPVNQRQLRRGGAGVSQLLTLGEPIDETPWHGTRPCLPDMLPMVGAAPKHSGLWFNFGHGHQGFTLGPTTARLLADAVTGETGSKAVQSVLSPLARI